VRPKGWSEGCKILDVEEEKTDFLTRLSDESERRQTTELIMKIYRKGGF